MTGLTIGLALLLAAGFLTCFEQRTVDEPTLASAEAMRNPYLAAGRLLEALGHEVRWLEGPGSLDDLPPAEATLLLTNSRDTLTELRARPLLAWVGSGGHLITSAHSTWERAERDPDPLIDPLGLFGYRDRAERSHEDGDEDERAAADEPETTGDVVEELDFTDLLAGLGERGEVWDATTTRIDGRALEVDFDPSVTWAEPRDVASFVAYGEAGAHLVQVDLGAGRVTALSDDHFVRNARIGERDHAELLARLVGPASAAAPVWIVISERWPGLLSQILEHAAPAAASAVALLVAWLWHASRRFGPILRSVEPERRRWIEHLDAVGRYHWHRDRGRGLIDAARTGLRRAIAQTHPAWARLPENERNERIGEASGLPAVQVEAALDDHAPSSEADAVRTIARIERIRASL
jgi:hypothetical protein